MLAKWFVYITADGFSIGFRELWVSPRPGICREREMSDFSPSTFQAIDLHLSPFGKKKHSRAQYTFASDKVSRCSLIELSRQGNSRLRVISIAILILRRHRLSALMLSVL